MNLHGTLFATNFKTGCVFVTNEWERFASDVPLISHFVRVSQSDDQEAVVVALLLKLSDVTLYNGPVF